MSVRGFFCDVRDDLNQVLVERESAVDNALIALVTGQHYLQLGPRGVGKSMLVDELAARITGAQQFSMLLNQSTGPDEVFGPVDLIEYADHGRWTRRRQGSITEAHICFLDEIYKCNSVVLNSLLKIINEGKLSEVGAPTQDVPLISLFGASNETPTDEALLAFDDRLVIRELIQPVVDDAAFATMLTAKKQAPKAYISLGQIYDAQQEVCQVKGTTEVLERILELRHACSREGIAVSDRRWKRSLGIAKARAWLDGNEGCSVEDLTALIHVLWTDPKEMKAVQRIVFAAACPLFLQALEMEDAAEDLVKKLPRDVDDPDYEKAVENCLLQLNDMSQELGAQIARSRTKNRGRAQASLTKILGYHAQVAMVLKKKMERLGL